MIHTSARRVLRWLSLGSAGALVFQAAGCMIDPDIVLRAGISASADLAIFLLENLAAGL